MTRTAAAAVEASLIVRLCRVINSAINKIITPHNTGMYNVKCGLNDVKTRLIFVHSLPHPSSSAVVN